MAEFLDNPFSSWIKGESFDIWADVMQLPITDGEPEFVWVDVETTGLDTGTDVTLELGILLTDGIGNICRDGVIDWRVYGSLRDKRSKWNLALDGMDEYVRNMHTKSGLLGEINRVRSLPHNQERLDPDRVEEDAIVWLHLHCKEPLQLSGSSPHFDRGFLKADLPILENWFHYRSGVDVSGSREIAKRVNPGVVAGQPTKMEMHRPIPDLVDSVRLYRHLLKNFFRMDEATTRRF